MRLICIPLWLSQALNREGLAESALLDQSALSPFFPQKDLECYDRLANETRMYFESVFGVTLPGHDEAPVHIDRPLNAFEKTGMDAVVERLEQTDKTDLAYKLIGRHLPPGFQWSFAVRPLSGPNSTDTVGLFVYVFEGTGNDKVEADKKFLAELLELLYAHNLTIDKLAMTGFLGAYVKRLG
jgi:hypothetical protein